MHSKTVKKVLTDEETLDVAKTAEAVQEIERVRAKKDKPSLKMNSVKAYVSWLARKKEKEELRQKLREIWNRKTNT